MGITVNIDQVQREVKAALEEKYGELIEINMVEATLETLQDLLEQSAAHRQTGHYWSSFDVGIGKPSTFVAKSPYERKVVEGKLKLRRARRRYSNPMIRAERRLKKYKPGKPIFISNAARHAWILEHGTVKMSPLAIVEKARMRAEWRIGRG